MSRPPVPPPPPAAAHSFPPDISAAPPWKGKGGKGKGKKGLGPDFWQPDAEDGARAASGVGGRPHVQIPAAFRKKLPGQQGSVASGVDAAAPIVGAATGGARPVVLLGSSPASCSSEAIVALPEIPPLVEGEAALHVEDQEIDEEAMAAKVEAFLRQNGIDTDGEAGRALFELRPELQRSVMAEDLGACSSPDAALLTRIGEKAAGTLAVAGQEKPSNSLALGVGGIDDIDNFVAKYGIDSAAASTLRRLRPDLQRLALEIDLGDCRNPSAALITGINRLKQQGEGWNVGSEGGCEGVHEFLARNGVDEEARTEMLSLPPGMQMQVMQGGNLIDCRNPSAVLLTRIGRARGRGGEWWQPPAPGVGPPLPAEHASTYGDVESFLARNAIDGEACRAFRALHPDLQWSVMRSDLTDCRNPSAALLARISKARRERRHGVTDHRPHQPFEGGGYQLQPDATVSNGEPSHTSEVQHMDEASNVADIEAFLEQHGIEDETAEAFRELRPELRSRIMETDLTGCKNASAALLARIARELQSAAAMVGTPHPPKRPPPSHLRGDKQGQIFEEQACNLLPPQPPPAVLPPPPPPPPPRQMHWPDPPAGFEGDAIAWANEVECFLRRNGIDESASQALRELQPDGQKWVMQCDLRTRRNPSSCLITLVRQARELAVTSEVDAHSSRTANSTSTSNYRGHFSSRASPPSGAPAPSDDEVKTFLHYNGIDGRASEFMWKLSPEMRGQVMDCDMSEARNPSAFIVSICQRAASGLPILPERPRQPDGPRSTNNGDIGTYSSSSHAEKDNVYPEQRGSGAASPPDADVEAFLQYHRVDERASQMLRQSSPELRRQVMGCYIFAEARNPSAIIVSMCRSGSVQLTQPEVATSFGGENDAHSSSKATSYHGVDDQLGRGRLPRSAPPSDAEVEMFLSFHGIDDRAGASLKQLSPQLRGQVMDCDMKDARNPSAFIVSMCSRALSGQLPPNTQSVNGRDAAGVGVIQAPPPPMQAPPPPMQAPPPPIQAPPPPPPALVSSVAAPAFGNDDQLPHIGRRDWKRRRVEPNSVYALDDEAETQNENSEEQNPMIGNVGANNFTGGAESSTRPMPALGAPPPLTHAPPNAPPNSSVFAKARSRADYGKAFIEERPMPQAPRFGASVASAGVARGTTMQDSGWVEDGYRGIAMAGEQNFGGVDEVPAAKLRRIDAPVVGSHLAARAGSVSAGAVLPSPPPPNVPAARAQVQGTAPAFTLVRHCKGRGSMPLPDDGVCNLPTSLPLLASCSQMTVGRSTSCDICLPVKQLSKVHAKIHMKKQPTEQVDNGNVGWVVMLEDLSSNGTWLNGQKMPPKVPVEVRPGDRISLLPPSTSVKDVQPLAFDLQLGGVDNVQGGPEASAANDVQSTIRGGVYPVA